MIRKYGKASRFTRALASLAALLVCQMMPSPVRAQSVSFGPGAQLGLAIRNALKDRYAVTLNSTLQGTHYARPRSIELQLTFGPNSDIR